MARRRGLSFYTKKKKVSSNIMKEVISYLVGMVIAVFVAAVAVYFYGMSIHTVGVSMEPTLVNGQQILIDRFRYVLSSPKKGDVVVFLPNGNENTHYYVKRVVACPGDKLFVKNGVLYVNGIQSTLIQGKILDAGIAENELVMGMGEYFCIGDDPNNSEDSRSANIGTIREEEMVGMAWFKLSYEEEHPGLIK